MLYDFCASFYLFRIFFLSPGKIYVATVLVIKWVNNINYEKIYGQPKQWLKKKKVGEFNSSPQTYI